MGISLGKVENEVFEMRNKYAKRWKCSCILPARQQSICEECIHIRYPLHTNACGMPCVHIRTKNRVMEMEMKKEKKLVQHQRRRSSSMTKSNRNTTRPFLADVYFRLPLQRRTKNEMCSRWCCRRRLHCTYAHRPNARTHRYGAVLATQRPVYVSLVRVHTRAMQQMCLVERTNNVHAVVWQQRLVVCD